MPRLDLHEFIRTAGEIAAGQARGQIAGQQAAMAQQQQIEQQRAQRFAQMQQLAAAEQERRNKPLEFLAGNLKLFSPDAQAKAIGDISKAYAGQTSPYTATGYQDYLRTGQMPVTPPTVTPGTIPTTSTYGVDVGANGLASRAAQLRETQPQPQVPPSWWQTPFSQTTPAPVPSTAPGAPPAAPSAPQAASAGAPAPAAPPVAHTALGDYALGGGVKPGILAQLGQARQGVLRTISGLPQGDPRRAQLTEALQAASGNPESDDTAMQMINALSVAQSLNAPETGPGVGLRGRNLATYIKEAPKEWLGIKSVDPHGSLDALLAFSDDAEAMDAQGKAMGVPVRHPAGYEGERRFIQQMRAAMQAGDVATAQDLANQIQGRMKENITFKEETARGNLAFKAITRLAPDEDFDKNARAIYEQNKIGYLFPEGGSLAGAARERILQSLIGKLPGLKGVDTRTGRVLLGEIRSFMKLTGRDPSTVPEEVRAKLDPNQQADLDRKMREASVWQERITRERDQFKQATEAHTAKMKALQAKGGAGGITAAQKLAAALARWKGARTKVEDLRRQLDFMPSDLEAGGTFLKPGEKEVVRKALDAQQQAQKDYEKLYQGTVVGAPSAGGGTPQKQGLRTITVNGQQMQVNPATFNQDAARRGWSPERIRQFRQGAGF